MPEQAARAEAEESDTLEWILRILLKDVESEVEEPEADEFVKSEAIQRILLTLLTDEESKEEVAAEEFIAVEAGGVVLFHRNMLIGHAFRDTLITHELLVLADTYPGSEQAKAMKNKFQQMGIFDIKMTIPEMAEVLCCVEVLRDVDLEKDMSSLQWMCLTNHYNLKFHTARCSVNGYKGRYMIILNLYLVELLQQHSHINLNMFKQYSFLAFNCIADWAVSSP